ncbi:alpha/beta hydrolase [Cryptosporangium sp. NPDC051539]|uniref:alpha/beta hydrolase n=1 Tax=Cryptosporangium sp. NPDC051539 TaxID=3363962 RepID=UPI003797EF7F
MKATIVLLLSGLVLVGSLAVTGWWATGNSSSRPQQPLGAEAWTSVVAAIAPNLDRADVPDPASASPAAVAAFVHRLTPRQRGELVRLAPATIGNLDGVPITMRYQANESVLAGTAPRAVENTLTVASASNVRKDRTTDVRPGRTLAYDPRGDGRVVQVLGDLDRAKHIAVLVPGSKWRGPDILRWPHGRRLSPLANAVELQRSAGPDTAVVVWLGYDAPERIDMAAVGSARAIAGAPALRRFLQSLPAAHTTLICHSYGSVVCGRAAAGSPVDEIVAIGSPGLDANSVAGLHTDARVWAARTADDPIQITPPVRIFGLGHGTSPVNPAFGAHVFRTGTITGHDQYLQAGSESLENITRIVVGRDAEVTLR